MLTPAQESIAARLSSANHAKLSAYMTNGLDFAEAMERTLGVRSDTPAGAILASIIRNPEHTAAEAKVFATGFTRGEDRKFRDADGLLATPAQALEAARAERGIKPPAPTAEVSRAEPTAKELRQARLLAISQIRRNSSGDAINRAPTSGPVASTLAAFRAGESLQSAADRFGVHLDQG